MKRVANVLLVSALLALNLALHSASSASQLYATTEQTTPFTTLAGWLTIIWGDGRPGSNAVDRAYVLSSDDGEAAELLLSQELIDPLGGVLALNQARVIVQGQWMRSPGDGTGSAIFDVGSIKLDPLFLGRSAISPQIIGSQPWISILCKFSDVSDEPKSLSYFQDMYSSTYPGLDHYWREQSYGVVNVQGSGAVGWFTLPHPRSHYVYDMDGDGDADSDRTSLANDCTAVADASVTFPNYVGINLMFNDELDGFAWGGGRYLSLDGVGRWWWRLTWEPPWGYGSVGVIEHEMGHGFGLPHSSGPYGQTYDNEWDVMSDHWAGCYRGGNNRHPVYGCMGQHTISFHKDLLGWIPAGRKFVPTPGSQTQVVLEQLALPSSPNYLIAQIPIQGSSSHFYTVEARRLTGYDSHNPVPGNAVVVHEVDLTRGRPANIVDETDDGDPSDEGSMWLPGEMFTDTPNGVRVCVRAATATGFVVTVGLGVVIDCPIEADMSSSTLYADPVAPAAGQQVTLTTSLINWGSATASGLVLTFTIPNSTTLIPGSAWASQGTITGTDPVVFDVGDVAFDAPVTLTFVVTVSAQITKPTVLSGTVTIQWTGGSLVREHTVIANAETVYLPAIFRSYYDYN